MRLKSHSYSCSLRNETAIAFAKAFRLRPRDWRKLLSARHDEFDGGRKPSRDFCEMRRLENEEELRPAARAKQSRNGRASVYCLLADKPDMERVE